MAAFSGGVSACNVEIQNKTRKSKLKKKSGCFGFRNEKALRSRIKQFSIWFSEKEEYKNKDYSKRRSDKQKRRTLFTKEKFVKRLRWLKILTAIFWFAGVTMTLCSTVKSIGKETPFYIHKDTFRVVGPLVLSVGVILLLLMEGLKMNFKLREGGQRKPKFYIIQTSDKKRKGQKERKLFRLSPEMKCVSIEDIDMEIEPPDGSSCDVRATMSDVPYHLAPTAEERFLPISNNKNENKADTEYINSKSTKRKRNNWRRFHWTKLSHDSTSSAEFDVIDENHVMESSGDSASFRQQMPPRSPCGTFENPLARQWSTNSRTSTSSKYSNFNDDAPLVKCDRK